MKNVLKITKSVLIPFGLPAEASATGAIIQKKTLRSGMTALIVSNEEMNNIMKIVTSIEEPDLLINDIREKIKSEQKRIKRWIS